MLLFACANKANRGHVRLRSIVERELAATSEQIDAPSELPPAARWLHCNDFNLFAYEPRRKARSDDPFGRAFGVTSDNRFLVQSVLSRLLRMAISVSGARRPHSSVTGALL